MDECETHTSLAPIYGYAPRGERLRLWVPRKRGKNSGEETIIEDVVRYRLPFALFGDIFHPLVRLQLKRIFRFRQSAVRSCLLGADEQTGVFTGS